ncbi:hypothetical protein [uncultured Pseudacidovorax sp.]|uniref:hypothetical protein n=1 Tax=uncultured Pseudacidovorax sp. TaxID=679313 RepID=UPI0025E1B4F3|nr:hypothetical protein [uncultured Pseudacidovorax sp.]
MSTDLEFMEAVDWRVVFSDPEDGAHITVRVRAVSSDEAVDKALVATSDGAARHRPWLQFDHCETLPDRDWEASSYRLGLMQRALRRSDMELNGRRAHYEATARCVASHIIDRGV